MNKEREQSLPEARKEGLIVQELSEEVLIYDRQRHKAHCLNRTAALVWERCDGKTAVKEIARRVSKKTGQLLEEEVAWLAVEELAKRRLLEPIKVKAGMSRREMIKRAGVGVAVALPVVTSIVAPKAAQAATCRASGQACTTSAQCCSGVCTGGACA